MIGFQQKKQNYRFTGKMVVLSRPVYRMKRLHRLPQELKPEEANARIGTKVWDRYGSYQFFPTALKDRYLTEAMIDSGLFSCFTFEEAAPLRRSGFFGSARPCGPG